jgi:hypothetical protein
METGPVSETLFVIPDDGQSPQTQRFCHTPSDSGQIHDPAALSPRKQYQHPLYRKLGGPLAPAWDRIPVAPLSRLYSYRRIE